MSNDKQLVQVEVVQVLSNETFKTQNGDGASWWLGGACRRGADDDRGRSEYDLDRADGDRTGLVAGAWRGDA